MHRTHRVRKRRENVAPSSTNSKTLLTLPVYVWGRELGNVDQLSYYQRLTGTQSEKVPTETRHYLWNVRS